MYRVFSTIKLTTNSLRKITTCLFFKKKVIYKQNACILDISPIHTFVDIPALIRKRSVFLSSRAGMLAGVLIGDILPLTVKNCPESFIISLF